MIDARAKFALDHLLSAASALYAAAPAIDSLDDRAALREALADARSIINGMVHRLDAAMGEVVDELGPHRDLGELAGLPESLPQRHLGGLDALRRDRGPP